MATYERRVGSKGTTYKVRIRIHGIPEQVKSFKRLTDAKLWAQQTESAIQRGEFKSVIKNAKSHTLANVILRYREEVLPSKAESTIRSEDTYLKWWNNELGEYSLSYITPDLISTKLKLLATGGDSRKTKTAKTTPKSPKTIKLYRNTLSLLFKHAKYWGLVGANPLDSVQPMKGINNARVRFLSDDERHRLIQACRNSPNKMLYPIVIFALSTGARLGEIKKLEIRDIDLERSIAILRDTKNGETRSVPIVGHLHTIMSDHITWLRKLYKANPHLIQQWVFPRTDGLKPIDIRKAWENARSEAKIEDFRFHDLRHSAASYLAMNGASLLDIAAVLGHKTLQMVKRYSHLSEAHTSNIVKKMNNKIFE